MLVFKKIIDPKDELNYRLDSIDNKYLINEPNRAIGFFAATSGTIIPTQISTKDLCYYVIEGQLNINMDDKTFEIHQEEMILIPHSSAYDMNFSENAKVLFIRI